MAGLALPWALLCLVLSRRAPERLLSPLVPAVDLLVLLALELAVPDTYGAVRITALFLIAAHAVFQGERRGMLIAALGSAVLVLASALRGDSPLPGNVHAFYETVFVIASVATGLVVGSLRTAESASRLRARRLSRRTIQAEAQVRRRVAATIHDGPVQELIGLDMILGVGPQGRRRGPRRRRRRPARRGARARPSATSRSCATSSSTSARSPSRSSPSRPPSRTACRSGSAATASR